MIPHSVACCQWHPKVPCPLWAPCRQSKQTNRERTLGRDTQLPTRGKKRHRGRGCILKTIFFDWIFLISKRGPLQCVVNMYRTKFPELEVLWYSRSICCADPTWSDGRGARCCRQHSCCWLPAARSNLKSCKVTRAAGTEHVCQKT